MNDLSILDQDHSESELKWSRFGGGVRFQLNPQLVDGRSCILRYSFYLRSLPLFESRIVDPAIVPYHHLTDRQAQGTLTEKAESRAIGARGDGPCDVEHSRVAPVAEEIHPPLVIRMFGVALEVQVQIHVLHQLDQQSAEEETGPDLLPAFWNPERIDGLFVLFDPPVDSGFERSAQTARCRDLLQFFPFGIKLAVQEPEVLVGTQTLLKHIELFRLPGKRFLVGRTRGIPTHSEHIEKVLWIQRLVFA